MYHSTSFADAVGRAANLLGDADTTSAIAGQLAGAFYGMGGPSGVEATAGVALECVNRWDPDGDIALRGALLYNLPTA